MCRVGQNHIYIYGVYTFFWQGNHQIYVHIRCIYTVLANPKNVAQHRYRVKWLFKVGDGGGLFMPHRLVVL